VSPSSLVLSNSSFVGSSAGAVQQWTGGRAALVTAATSYSSGVLFQTLGPDNVSWITLNSGTITTNSYVEYSLTRGQYRIISNSGTTVGLFATLASVEYS
jgi:hypothetical protein